MAQLGESIPGMRSTFGPTPPSCQGAPAHTDFGPSPPFHGSAQGGGGGPPSNGGANGAPASNGIGGGMKVPRAHLRRSVQVLARRVHLASSAASTERAGSR